MSFFPEDPLDRVAALLWLAVLAAAIAVILQASGMLAGATRWLR